MRDKKKKTIEESISLREIGHSYESFEVSRLKLRQRWELASVLNFLSVFQEMIGEKLKMSAEEIEIALINSNASLAKLHITLLKGIPPVNKKLSNPDVWVTILCKKLAEWWPWVAEGDVPLIAAKGEELHKYKELDPTNRLQMLKALCEIRTEQDDIVSYINDALKKGKRPSDFRKDKICRDGSGVSYWYDGNSVIGHRLYKEVNKSVLKKKHKGKACSDSPNSIEWETLATNLDEFHHVLEQFSSSKVGVKATICKTIETEVIPVLEKLHKKKERALKRQQKQDALLKGYQSITVGATRSCRARGPVSYTFDEYDRAIDEALNSSRKRKGPEVQQRQDRRNRKQLKRENITSDEESEKDFVSKDRSPTSTEEKGSDDRQVEESDNEYDTKNIDSYGENDTDQNGSEKSESREDDEDESESSDSEQESSSLLPKGNCNDNNEKTSSGSSSSDGHPPTQNTDVQSLSSCSKNGSDCDDTSSAESGDSGEDPALISDFEDETHT